MNVVMVCVGNICRSPMAEGLAKLMLPDHSIESAGIGALIGRPADPLAIELMDDRSIDISSHRARQISKLICTRADLILVMEYSHKQYIEERYSFCRGKVFRLTEKLGQDVPDPYREERRAFVNALDLIENGLDIWAKQIKKLSFTERQTT